MNKIIFYSIAVIAIGAIEAVALIKGINGALLMIALSGIGAIAGFVAGKKV